MADLRNRVAEKTGLPLSQLRLISRGCTLAEEGTVQLKAGGATSSRRSLRHMQHLIYLFGPVIGLQVPSWLSKPECQCHSILLQTLAQWHWTTVTGKTTKQQYVSSCQGAHHNGRDGLVVQLLTCPGLPASPVARKAVCAPAYPAAPLPVCTLSLCAGWLPSCSVTARRLMLCCHCCLALGFGFGWASLQPGAVWRKQHTGVGKSAVCHEC